MHDDDPMKWDPYAPRRVDTASGFLAASYFCSLFAMLVAPVFLGPAAIVLACLAAGFGRRGAGFFAGLVAIAAMTLGMIFGVIVAAKFGLGAVPVFKLCGG